jgi:hypothetical protein
MANYVGSAPLRSYQPGSLEYQAGVDPDTGLIRYAPGSSEWKSPYLIENDPTRTLDERAAAKAARLLAEAAAGKAAVEAFRTNNGIPPHGWVVVQHTNDAAAAISIGEPLDDGRFLIRDHQVEQIAPFGFRPVQYTS